LGVNGSATVAIEMKNVEIPESQIITKEAKSFASAIRPQFVAVQIPIALGSIRTSLDLIHKFSDVQNGINKYLDFDSNDYELQYKQFKNASNHINASDDLHHNFAELIKIKKQDVYLLLEVNQASMVHGGSRAFSPRAPYARKLK